VKRGGQICSVGGFLGFFWGEKGWTKGKNYGAVIYFLRAKPQKRVNLSVTKPQKRVNLRIAKPQKRVNKIMKRKIYSKLQE